jgi:hypothetical protein
MKPSGILFFLLSVFGLLIAIAFVFPTDGIRLSDDLKINFFSREDVLGSTKVKYADINNILNQQKDDFTLLSRVMIVAYQHMYIATQVSDVYAVVNGCWKTVNHTR